MAHPTMQRIFDKTGKTAAEIARILDTTPQNINNWSSRGISKRGALQLAKAFNLSVDWILTGEGETTAEAEVREMIANMPNGITHDEIEPWRNSIPVDVYDLKFCCGDGNGSTEFEPLKKTLPFDESFFARRKIKPQNFKLIYAKGDSMSPYINEGDAVGIDINDTQIKEGEVYALWLDGDWMIKRFFKEGGGVLRLSSDNTAYKDKIIDDSNGESLIIIGRVAYRSG